MSQFLSHIADSLLEWFIPLMLIVIVGAVVIGAPVALWSIYEESKSPVITLQKDEWVATHYRERSVTTYVMSGKVMIPITTYEKTPDQYNLK